MFLQPKNFKYKKIQKGKLARLNFKTNKLAFGILGIKAIESGIIKSKHIEACRQAISRKIKRKGKIWIRIFPDYPVTNKPTESRMGKGKGNVSHWAVKVKSGTVLFEICVKTLKLASEALYAGKSKLPLKTKICV